MSIVTTETATLPRYISLAEAAKALPSAQGQTPHVASLHRWATHGVAGVRLRCILVGRCRCTTVEWLSEFFSAVTAAKEAAAGRTPRKVSDDTTRKARERAERANRELEMAGL